MKHVAYLLGIGVVAGFVLSACSTDQKHGLCPNASILANTANATMFKDKMEGDPSGELYEVTVTGVTSNCSFDKDEGTADSSLTLTFR
ncbi:MAG TPA: hypothetical protein VGJ08_10255, partial [Rhizomicrobium sp.]